MSADDYNPRVSVRECTRCGWQQSTGRGEALLACPDCGAMSWHRVPTTEGSRP